MRRLLIGLLGLSLLASACDGGVAEPTTTTSVAATTTAAPTTTTTTLPPTPEAAEAAGLPWWNDRVFYEVFVRSFSDSDGDGNGDLQGLIDRLDYLNDGDPATTDDLGVTGIWLMPVFDSPSYHGYDVIDYRDVEDDYGTNEDLAELVDAAHERGIAVIVDLVLNHTSVEHPWFELSASGGPAFDDWYLWSDTNPAYLGPWNQTVWHPSDDRFYYGLFWEGMPDLNLENPKVTAQLHDIAHYWLDEVGVDGYRIDGAKHFIEDGEVQADTPATHAWLTGFQTAMPEEALILGEVWSPTQTVSRYIPEALDLAFEFDLGRAIIGAADTASAASLRDTINRVVDSYPFGQYATFLSNHDQDRVMSQLDQSPDKAKLAASLLLTLPGVPFVYYGEELGMPGRKPDPRLRSPMPWTADDPGVGFTTGEPWENPQRGFENHNVAALTADPDSLLSFYRDLIHLRNESPALRLGELVPIETGARPVVAYLRTIGDEHVLVVANFARGDSMAYELSLPAGPLVGVDTAEALIGDALVAGPEISEAGGLDGYKPLDSLPGRSVLIIRLSQAGP